MCEDSKMLKVLLGGYLGLYVVAAVALKLVLPTIPSNQVNSASIVPSSVRETVSSLDLSWPWAFERNGMF